MQQLVAQAKGDLGSVGAALAANNPSATAWPFAAKAAPTSLDNSPLPLPISLGGLAFAGLLRTNRYGSSSIDVLSTPQYDVAANAAFTNLNTAGAWQTQGSVDVAPSTAPAGSTPVGAPPLSGDPSAGSGQASTGLNSNTATVTLTVTSVNDAPTGASATTTTLEDTTRLQVGNALITARGAPAHERVIHILRAWSIRIDEALFLGGMDKGAFLKVFGADIFFDDQQKYCESACQHVATGHVPHGVANEP